MRRLQGLLSERRRLTVLAGIVAAMAFLRFWRLDAFPVYEADEGLWTNSAKNFVEYGDWFMDGRTHVFLSPVFHGLQVFVFEILGSGIPQARAISALMGLVAVLLIAGVTLRASGDRSLAIIVAVLFGFSQWIVLVNRRALIESTQMVLGLTAVWLLLSGTRKGSLMAGIAFGLGLLTKLNLAFLAVPLGVWVVLDARSRASGARSDAPARLLWLGMGCAVTAGVGYGVLYLLDPSRFLSAFAFEVVGSQFEPDSLVRFGRFGLAPVLSARSIVSLFREAPFLWVLATLGLVTGWSSRRPGTVFMGVWLGVGALFTLLQLYQPLRYFLLVSPPAFFFAGVAVKALADGSGTDGTPVGRRTVLALYLTLYTLFNVSYVAMNAVSGREHRMPVVEGWFSRNADAGDRVMAAGYLATDLPLRTYAHYHYDDPDRLLAHLRMLEIDWVVYDRAEWRAELRDIVRDSLELAEAWDFGEVYRVPMSR